MELLVQKTYNNQLYDFYNGANDEIYLTREQIGTALGYANPTDSIKQIHKRHKNRLDNLCIRLKQKTSELSQSHEGGQSDPGRERSQNKYLESEIVYYSERGVMEICRWSDSENANAFMDWVWDIVASYRHGEIAQLKENYSYLLNELTKVQTQFQQISEQYENRLRSLEGVEKLETRWHKYVYDQIHEWQKRREHKLSWMNDDNQVIAALIETMELDDQYEMTRFTQDYMEQTGDILPDKLAVIESFDFLKNAFEKKLHDFISKEV